jgi:hypothetical protein
MYVQHEWGLKHPHMKTPAEKIVESFCGKEDQIKIA